MGFRKTIIIFTIAMIVYMDGRAQVIAGRPLTLQECVQTAITNNLDVQQSDLQLQRAGVNLFQSKANLLPNISGSIEHTANQGRNIDLTTNSFINQQYTNAYYSLQANMTLFNGLRLMNTIKSNQYAYDASKMELQWGKDQLMLKVILAYLQILSSTDLLEQAQQQAAVSQKQVERLQIMNEEGAIKPSDLTDVQGLLADNKLNVINNLNSLNGAKLSLSQLMNIPYNQNLQVERVAIEQFDMHYTATPDSIINVALEQLSLIKGADLRKKSAEKAVQAARGSFFPSIGIGSGLNSPFSSRLMDSSNKKITYYDQLRNNYGTYVSVGINIPILNNFRFRNQVKLAKIDLKEAEVIAHTREVQLRQAIEQDYFNMTAALNKYRALQEQVKAYTESFQAAEARFNAGASTSVDYLISKNNMDRANINLIIARYDFLLRTKILDFYQSKPLW
jgi:outer membrane protein